MHRPVILDLIQNPQGGAYQPCHSRRPVIADLIRNPEGRRTGGRHSHPGPSFPRKRESRRGWVTMRCIVILDLIQNPQGGTDNKTTPTISPSPLMGEESGPVPVLDTGIRG